MQDKRTFVSLLQQSVRDYQSHTSMFMNASENKKKRDSKEYEASYVFL